MAPFILHPCAKAVMDHNDGFLNGKTELEN